MHKITAENRAGLTLTEMMVALGVGCIVFLAVATVLVGGQRSMDRTFQQANLQRDASRTMLMMKKFIRFASKAEVNPDGNEVTIYHTSGWVRFRFVRTQKDLRYQIEGEDEITLLDGIVENAAFEIDPDANKIITVDLELQNNSSRTRLSSSTMMRNYTSGT
jgi:prepilin-type N-terminal cleavage/methylation domain-containing protein